MAVYKLNGLDLPRTAKAQWASGSPLATERLSEGDLVFFSTKRKGDVSHVVYMWAATGLFMHPARGKIYGLNPFRQVFSSRYIGARTYLE
jgi:cell wall-associated NlpC family hydrolase